MTEQTAKGSLAANRDEPNVDLDAGETAIRYRDLLAMNGALALLASKHLPTKEARIHVGGCIRALKPHIDDYHQERERIHRDHTPVMEHASEGDTISFVDPIGMKREMAELDWGWAAVKLPKKIKSEMFPVNDKNHPQNELGVSAILADLGPLYPIEIQYDDEPDEAAA